MSDADPQMSDADPQMSDADPQMSDAGSNTGVAVGDRAPVFNLVDQHGVPVRLSDYLGKMNVVIVFYPLAFSPVCHGELKELRSLATPMDTEIVTISVDSMFSHRAWAESEGFEFRLLSDFWPHGEVAKSYGVFDEEKGVALRGTFIIDKDGIVRWRTVNAIPDARDTEEYSKVLSELS